MIEVKFLESPPAGAHWSMGPDYMVRISAGDAAKVRKGSPLRMGFECDMSVNRAGPHGQTLPRFLMLQNLGGHFYLASPHARIPQWPELFGVSVSGFGRAAA